MYLLHSSDRMYKPKSQGGLKTPADIKHFDLMTPLHSCKLLETTNAFVYADYSYSYMCICIYIQL